MSYIPIPQQISDLHYYQSEEIIMSSNNRLLGENAELADKIQELTKQNAKLERMLAKIGTKGDDQAFRNSMEKQRASAKDLSKEIMGSLKNHHSGDSGDKQIFQKLTKQFQAALGKFNSINKEIENKQNHIVQRMSVSTGRNSAAAGKKRGSSTAKGDPESQHLIDDRSTEKQRTESQQQADQLLEQEFEFTTYNEQELLARKEEIMQIERDVVEVAEMFKDLQTLVHDQQEHIDIIETNIESAHNHTDAGYKELVAAEQYQKKARRKLCCIVVIVVVVITLIVLVFKLK